MIHALIETATGLVVNAIEIADGAKWEAPEGFYLHATGSGAIGDTWNGTEFVAPVPDAVAPVVPRTVTPLQARRALRAAGLLATVNAWVASQADEDIKAAWEFASVIKRHDPLTLGAAAALGLTDAQLDGLFLAAAKL
jgi:hypothetical protein